MTPLQTFTVAALGGLAALLGLVLTIALVVGIYLLASRIYEAIEDLRLRREQQRELAAWSRQLEQLPTTTETHE
ncbi:hypothetical protein ACFOOM_07690 [Streptomyces echinoruber]|uniref:Uncharacterized protein n=1 Tax=Streptomyces echinoruber TaxID=68898 RepID=A0A918QZN6_9ACTN|nr:hypothetical protein [Streptomyces echinoruber]GGZ80393.1 hypothetical protein GCM10010389_17770 [Streptomyces echinoruber]